MEPKSKLGFIDGSIDKPTEGTIELQKWLQCDYVQIEKQRQVSGGMQGHQEVEACSVQKQGPKSTGRKDIRRSKNDKYCDHCKIRGHQTDQCFKLHGYPDWYKEKFGSKMKTAAHVGVQGTPLDNFTYPFEESPVNAALVNAVCQEVLKALNGKHPSDNSVNMTSIQADDGFTGNTTIATSFIASNCLQTTS